MEVYEDFEHTYWYVKSLKDRDDYMIQASPKFLRALHVEKTRVATLQHPPDGENKECIEVCPCSTHTFKVQKNDVTIERWQLKHLRTYRIEPEAQS